MRRITAAFLCLLFLCAPVRPQSKSEPCDKFRQLEEILLTPNEYRTVVRARTPLPAAAHGYLIDVELDDALDYLWPQ